MPDMNVRNEDELNDIQRRYHAGMKVVGMMQHAGFQEVVLPHLTTRREGLVRELINAPDYEKVLHLQHAIKAQDDLLTVIEGCAQEAKELAQTMTDEKML